MWLIFIKKHCFHIKNAVKKQQQRRERKSERERESLLFLKELQMYCGRRGSYAWSSYCGPVLPVPAPVGVQSCLADCRPACLSARWWGRGPRPLRSPTYPQLLAEHPHVAASWSPHSGITNERPGLTSPPRLTVPRGQGSRPTYYFWICPQCQRWASSRCLIKTCLSDGDCLKRKPARREKPGPWKPLAELRRHSRARGSQLAAECRVGLNSSFCLQGGAQRTR